MTPYHVIPELLEGLCRGSGKQWEFYGTQEPGSAISSHLTTLSARRASSHWGFDSFQYYGINATALSKWTRLLRNSCAVKPKCEKVLPGSSSPKVTSQNPQTPFSICKLASNFILDAGCTAFTKITFLSCSLATRPGFSFFLFLLDFNIKAGLHHYQTPGALNFRISLMT